MTDRTVKKADAAIQHFEEKGRSVVAVEISRDRFKLEFAQADQNVKPVDMVNMESK